MPRAPDKTPCRSRKFLSSDLLLIHIGYAPVRGIRADSSVPSRLRVIDRFHPQSIALPRCDSGLTRRVRPRIAVSMVLPKMGESIVRAIFNDPRLQLISLPIVAYERS